MARSISLLLLAFVTYSPILVNAQLGFDWIWPPPFGLVDSQKSIAPCGGFTANDDLTTHFLNQLRWNQSNVDITYMSRVTQSVTAIGVPENFTELYPTVMAEVNTNTTDKVQFCIPVQQPSGFQTRPTIFQLIAKTKVGIIFACSRVTFQNDANQTFALACNPDIRGNNTLVTGINDRDLLNAANLVPGQTATVDPSSSSTSSVSQESQSTGTPAASSQGSTSSSSLSAGAIAGIVVGALAFAGVIILLALFFMRRGRNSKSKDDKLVPPAERTGTTTSSSSRYDSLSTDKTHELPAAVPAEMDAEHNTYAELPARDYEKELRTELPANGSNPDLQGVKAQPQEPPVSRPNTASVSRPTTSGVSPEQAPAVPAAPSVASDDRPISPITPTSPISFRTPVSPIRERNKFI